MNNYRLTLCYDGTRYNGWQKQGNTPNTIQEKLETLLSRMLDQPIEAAGSGRTDAGVHAAGQVVSFRAETDRSPEELLRELRQYLPEDIGAVGLELAPPRFHARLNCTGKTYLYRVWNSDAPCVFQRRYVYVYPQALDLSAMEQAAALLCGTHDFQAFCGRRMKKSTVRTVRSIDIARVGEEVRLRFSGDGFLYHMVRVMTGTLLEVGDGRRSPESIPDVLASRDRVQAGFLAPARGLILEDVTYENHLSTSPKSDILYSLTAKEKPI